MCTAISFKTKDHYFGRNLDLEYSYNEMVTITPRNFSLDFRKMGQIKSHYAIIGMAYVCDNYPLYYDATNEKGLSIAGLNFPNNAHYNNYCDNKDNVTPFELIPWILCQCSTVCEAKTLLSRINILNECFSDKLALTPLHWIITDSESSITLESVKTKIKIYDNTVGVLTNNPTFDYHIFNLNNYMKLSKKEPINSFINQDLNIYSRGMGAIGLPGDSSSMSRFVRATFIKSNSVCNNTDESSISQFFHILSSVEMTNGCVEINKNQYEMTVYSSCCNTTRGVYYYTTYNNRQINAIDMHKENLDGNKLICFTLNNKQNIRHQN